MAQNLLTPAFTAFEHMALDETLAREALSAPVLRFYNWTPGPAVTFGYAQFYDCVRHQTGPEAGPLVRRPTGGGMVFHGEDLTFSLIFESALSNPREIYALLHAAIENSLCALGAPGARLQGPVSARAYEPNGGGKASGCFANPVENDLLAGGQKILGGAIRRFGNTVLYQGSLQCPHARTDETYRRAVLQGARDALDVTFEPRRAAAELLERARALARDQYETKAWNEKF